jgi:hypothetical protein
MPHRKSTAEPPETLDASTGRPIPTPPINLHDLEAVRREMARVYREMRARKLDTQDGTRLVYVLSQIAKMHEVALLEGRLLELERMTYGTAGANQSLGGPAAGTG